MDKNKLLLIADAIISVVIIAGILYYIGADKIFAELSNINYFYLALSVLFLCVMHLGMVLRIKLILNAIGSGATKLIDIARAHFVGMLLADFTPARSGYFATVASLSYNHNVPSEKAMVAILGPQILDFILKVVVGTISILYLTSYVLKMNETWFIFLGAFVMVAMTAVMVLLLFSKKFLALFSFASKIPIASKIYAMFVRTQEHSDVVVKKLPELLGLMIFSWSGKAISWFFVAKSIGINLELGFPEPIFYYFLQPTLTLLEFIPSPTIAGLGLSEGGGAVLLAVFGITAAKAASFVFLARIKTTFVNLIAIPEAIKTMKKMKDSEFIGH
ncbi:MAG: lysylphosphatidylglycerol synthase transmembrane domain-containing protein [Candidatus Micrarchaeota archaeon]